MKRGLILFLTFIFLMLMFIPYLNSEEPITGSVITGKTTITGESVTGDVTDATLGISIGLNVEQPSVTLTRPENKTYITSQNLLLNFSSLNTLKIWYNVDNGTNTTIAGNTTFNTASGGHTLYLYANNTDGNETLDSVVFTVNESIFMVHYEEYFGSTKGASTDFNKSTHEALQNLSDIILEHTDHGKISFNEAINVTDNLDFNDFETNISANANISSNRIEINSVALPNFNKDATLYLYNLTFSVPRILKDGSVCPSLTCIQNSYTGGTLIFNVTDFTVYSAEETPEDELPTPPGGGGGGGLIFTTSVDEISISLEQGDVKTKEITISNLGNNKLSFLVSSDIGEFVKISEESFQLEAKEKKTIAIDFIARENTIPDLYLGNIVIEAKGVKKTIPIKIDVETREALFDILMEIPEKFLSISPGEDLLAKIELFNLVNDVETNVDLEYIIKDINENIVFSQTEKMSVKGKKTFEKLINITEDIEIGRYVLYVRVIYDNTIASSSAWFNIEKKFNWFRERKMEKIALIIFILIVIVIIIYKNRRVQRFLYGTEKTFLGKAFVKRTRQK